MKGLLVFGCVALAAGVVSADVWSDAMARFRYGEDTNGNGLFDEGEWIDELHGTDPDYRYYYVTSYLMDLQRPHTGMAILVR